MSLEGDKSPEEIEKEIEQTREELGETVAAVAQATDIKRKLGDPKPLAIAGGVLALALLWRLIRR
jgi:hypothetical protein